jgi:hypothetical protein
MSCSPKSRGSAFKPRGWPIRYYVRVSVLSVGFPGDGLAHLHQARAQSRAFTVPKGLRCPSGPRLALLSCLGSGQWGANLLCGQVEQDRGVFPSRGLAPSMIVGSDVTRNFSASNTNFRQCFGQSSPKWERATQDEANRLALLWAVVTCAKRTTVAVSAGLDAAAVCLPDKSLRRPFCSPSAGQFILVFHDGEPGWDRTNDHLIKSQMLYR